MRIYDSNSDPYDYCEGCAPTLAEARERHQFPVPPDANDGRGDCFDYDEAHPDYSDTDYTCSECGRALTDTD